MRNGICRATNLPTDSTRKPRTSRRSTVVCGASVSRETLFVAILYTHPAWSSSCRAGDSGTSSFMMRSISSGEENTISIRPCFAVPLMDTLVSKRFSNDC